MTARLGSDPYRNFRFRLEIDDIDVAAFSEATIGEMATEAVPYREGTDAPGTTRRLSGRGEKGNISLRKDVNDDMSLYDWKQAVDENGADSNRKNVSIILVDEEGNDKARWDIVEAWPIRYEVGEFSAMGNEVLVESIELVHEGISRTA